MTIEYRSTLEKILGELFPGHYEGLNRISDPCTWTDTYQVILSEQKVLYVKGTPRSRPEARITALLHQYRPAHIPAVLVDDLLPDDPWHWFLMEDAGECDQEHISPERAIQTAYVLGELQRQVTADLELANTLPHCRADQLQELAVAGCEWGLLSAAADQKSMLLELRKILMRAASGFDEIGIELAAFPSTCVHGDLWSGNIAFRKDEARLIDWGDALWGVGGISITNLILTAGDDAAAGADAVWEAFSHGWKRDVNEKYIQASSAAALVGSVVIDIEIAQNSRAGVEFLPGLIPNLKRLAGLWE